ncbi:MAG: hypothetical protein ACI8RT_001444 [Candidatus Azotimanducaceae bacterium]|jgi:hypothetical protein
MQGRAKAEKSKSVSERTKERKKELKNKRTRAIGRKKNGAN